MFLIKINNIDISLNFIFVNLKSKEKHSNSFENEIIPNEKRRLELT